MTKIIAFSGSHGVGKTSLLQRFSQEIEERNLDSLKVFQEINTGFYNMGFAFNGKGVDFDEVMFAQSQAFELGFKFLEFYFERSYDNRIIISDRCCIDTMIYSKYFVNKTPTYKKKYNAMLEDMERKCLKFLPKINSILLPPFQDFSHTSDRMSLEERDHIWEMMLDFFKNKSSTYEILKGSSTEERFLEVKKHLATVEDSNLNNFEEAIATLANA